MSAYYVPGLFSASSHLMFPKPWRQVLLLPLLLVRKEGLEPDSEPGPSDFTAGTLQHWCRWLCRIRSGAVA